MDEGQSSTSSSPIDSEMTVAEKVPTTHCQVQLVVAPTDPATQEKKFATKGKEVSWVVTQPRAWKVMQITSPLSEVTDEARHWSQWYSPTSPVQ